MPRAATLPSGAIRILEIEDQGIGRGLLGALEFPDAVAGNEQERAHIITHIVLRMIFSKNRYTHFSDHALGFPSINPVRLQLATTSPR